MKSRILLALLVTATLFTLGCASSNRSSGRTGLLVEPFDADNVGYHVNWSTHLKVPAGQSLSSVGVFDDLVLTVETPGNLITATAVRDGSLVWRRVMGQPTDRFYSPTRIKDTIYINSDHEIFSLNARTGKIQSIAKLDHVVGSKPAIIDHFALFGGSDGTVFAHDLQAGYAKWAYKLTSRIQAAPTQSGINVFAADSNGVYAMLDSRDGTLLWRGRTFGPMNTSAAIDRLGVYIACEDGSLYALDRASGVDKWIYRTDHPLDQTPLPVGLNVYLPDPAGGLIALNAIDGSVRWTRDKLALSILSRGDQLLIATPNSLQQVDAETGTVLDQVPTLKLKTVLSGPEGSVILVSPQGRMLRLNPIATP